MTTPFNQTSSQSPLNNQVGLSQSTDNTSYWQALLRRYWWVLVILLLILLSIIFQLISNSRQAPPTQEEVTNQPTIDQQRDSLPTHLPINYSGEIPELPASLTVYQLTSQPLDQAAANMAQRLGLNPVEGYSHYWLHPDKSQSLNYLEDEGLVQYNIISAQDQGESSPNGQINLENAKAKITELLDIIGVRMYIIHTDQAIFYDDEIEPAITTQENAASVVIPFTYHIGDYPLITHTFAADATTARLNNRGLVTNLTFSHLITDSKELRFEPTLSIEEAIENIKSGQSSVINLSEKDVIRVVFVDELSSVNLTGVTIEYRFFEQESTALPYFNFTGTAQTNEGKTVDISVLTPAISR